VTADFSYVIMLFFRTSLLSEVFFILQVNYTCMQVKVFSGSPAEIEEALNNLLKQPGFRLERMLQSQGFNSNNELIIAVTLFFEEGYQGTGVGFRRSI
jgi:hypothetical protein